MTFRRMAALLFLVCIAPLTGCRHESAVYASDAARAMEGKPFPAFVLPGPPGTDSLRSSSLAGRPALVVFWATWCPGCLEELEQLKRLRTDSTFQRAAVVLLSVDDPPAGALLALPKLDLPFPVALGASPLMGSLQLDAIPQSFVLDAQGKVVRAFTGGADPDVLLRTLREAGAR